jgi:hypothetical protein
VGGVFIRRRSLQWPCDSSKGAQKTDQVQTFPVVEAQAESGLVKIYHIGDVAAAAVQKTPMKLLDKAPDELENFSADQEVGITNAPLPSSWSVSFH